MHLAIVSGAYCCISVLLLCRTEFAPFWPDCDDPWSARAVASSSLIVAVGMLLFTMEKVAMLMPQKSLPPDAVMTSYDSGPTPITIVVPELCFLSLLSTDQLLVTMPGFKASNKLKISFGVLNVNIWEPGIVFIRLGNSEEFHYRQFCAWP